MERPALQRLLADIGQGLIDVVVVYNALSIPPMPAPLLRQLRSQPDYSVCLQSQP